MNHEVKTDAVKEAWRTWLPLNAKWPGKIDPVHCSVAGGQILEQGRPRTNFILILAVIFAESFKFSEPRFLC